MPVNVLVVGQRPLECTLGSRGRSLGGLLETVLKSLGAVVGPPGASFGLLGSLVGPLGGLLVASGGLLEASWGPLGASWGLLGAEGSNCPFGSPDWALSWSRLGGLLGRLGGFLGRRGALLGRLGPSWGCLGPSWGRIRSQLVPSWAVLGCLGAVLGRPSRNP